MSEQYIDPVALEIIRAKLWKTAKAKKITLEDIQDRTEFSYSQVYRIVRGKNNISVSGIIAVCRALEIKPSEVFDADFGQPVYPPLRKNMKSGK